MLKKEDRKFSTGIYNKNQASLQRGSDAQYRWKNPSPINKQYLQYPTLQRHLRQGPILFLYRNF